MDTVRKWAGMLRLALITSLCGMMLLLAGCGHDDPQEPSDQIDLAPFKEMARAAPCADIRNRLFLIDEECMFWDSAGECEDASFAQILFGNVPDVVLCRYQDSIAGPVKTCQDERHRDMFEIIIANLDEPDLGLGPEHRVQPIPF